jgi:hypothetical protein
MCRNEYVIPNEKMCVNLLDLVGEDSICIKTHRICENRNITKKCKFEKCGCRLNIVDIFATGELDLAIKDIINVANKYPVA